MGWNQQKAKERVAANARACRAADYSIVDLARERDFYRLGPTEICRAHGAHLYADATNMHLLVADAGNNLHEQKKIVRAVHALHRVEIDLAEEYGVGRMQMQGARFHGMCHKPYGEDEDSQAKRAACAVGFAITIQSYRYDAFNPVFTDLSAGLRSAVGVDSGQFLIANIGYRGDRELISLGSAANIAAKAIGGSGTIRITDRVYKLLPDFLRREFEKAGSINGTTVYEATGLRWKTRPDLAEKLGVTFDHEKWKNRTQRAKDDLALEDMDVAGVEEEIDLERLSARRSKRTDAAVFYTDIDGFTAAVQAAEKDDDVKSLVRVFHLIRAEFQTVIEQDYDGLALQHQGDCVLGIAYLPAGDSNDDRRRRKGLDIAIALQSSMEHVLNEYADGRSDLHVAVGMAAGKVLLTRVGKFGEREMVALSPPVDAAQALQRQTGAEQIRVAQEIYDAITDELVRDEFVKRGDSYLATGLTFPKLDEKEDEREEEAARAGRLGATATASGVVTVTDAPRPALPWGSED